MLKRINDALPELILGILIYEIVVEFTGIWFVKDKLGYSIGLLIGAATAIGMAVHMAVVLRDSMDVAESGRTRRIALQYVLRYLVVVAVFFATAYFEFMKEAFGRNVIGYMEKPVKKYEFNNYMKAAVNILSLETVIHIDSETEVKSKDVLLIGTDNGYTEVEMITGRKITGIRRSMKAWEKELQQYGFMRINDACIINCRYVKGFEGDNVVIKDIGVKLRVSRRKKADCVKFYRTYRAKSSKYI